MKRFQLKRNKDISGVSGIGIVAEGVQFTDGTCAMRWLTQAPSTAFYTSVQDIENIHGHEGATSIVWYDISDALLD